MSCQVAMVGGRGYVGAELMALLWAHPEFHVSHVASRGHVGGLVRDELGDICAKDLRFCASEPESLVHDDVDVYVLALPNGESERWVDAIDEQQSAALILDLSADRRTDDAWCYGLPECFRASIAASRRIANPGCYATAALIALWPYREYLCSSAEVFAVSGYSGAGRIANERNQVDALSDNIRPYALANHVHQQELSHYLKSAVHLMPHVAGFFRGLSATISVELSMAEHEARQRLLNAYQDEPLICLSEQAAEPGWVREQHHVAVGLPVYDAVSQRMVLTAALDNLSKGAASQALQNMNLAMGFSELMGVVVP